MRLAEATGSSELGMLHLDNTESVAYCILPIAYWYALSFDIVVAKMFHFLVVRP